MTSLFHTSCPQCGGSIDVQSATAVTVVCGYCHSMLVRSGEQLAHSGRHSVLLQDFTPLQIGTHGSWQGLLFTLVGRLQVQYEGGSWNEWHALLQDGRSAWLSEASDGFVFTRPETTPQIGQLPKFDDVKVGATFFSYGPKTYAVGDVRIANRSRYAAEGELPYMVPEQEEARVVDCRSTDSFMTLDYTHDSNKPEVFVGQGVTLPALGLQNLRNTDQIKQTAGKLKGENSNSQCPNCGGTVQWVAGMATQVVCQYCQSQIDFSQEQAQLVETRNIRMAQDESFRLKLGSEARILGQKYWVIGVMKQSEVAGEAALKVLNFTGNTRLLVPDGDPWFEYLLYSPTKGFLWLTEMAQNRWAIAKTLDVWPPLQTPFSPVDQNKRPVKKLYDYGGQVQFAAGAFYWQVAPQDVTYYVDFGRDNRKLSTSMTAFEQSWSAISDVPAAAVAAWFNNQDISKKPMDLAAADQVAKQALALEAKDFGGGNVQQLKDSGSNRATLWLMIYGFLNFPAILMGLFGEGLFGIIIVTLIVHWVLKFLFKNNG